MDVAQVMAGADFIQNLAVILLIAGGTAWLCQRCGFSMVAGYLLAGIFLGPWGVLESFGTSLSLISNTGHIQTLAEVGLMFLMFALGFNLNLSKLKRFGPSIIGGTLIIVIVLYNGVKLLGIGFGFGPTQSLFLAAMLMISSTTVITGVLQRTGTMHEKSSRLAMSVAVVEDAIAVLMLAVLGSLMRPRWLEWVEALGVAGGLLILIMICAVFIVPRFLSVLNRKARPEIQTILLNGFLLGMAWMAIQLGYPPALGAILVGAVIAGTKYRAHVEKVFSSFKDVFTAIFFTTAGMLFNIQTLAENWLLVLGLSVMILIGKPLISSFILALTGRRSRETIPAGLMLIPIGEFSIIFAQVGISAKALPESFNTIVVAVALLTILGSSVLVRFSDGITWLTRKGTPFFFRDWLAVYHTWLDQATRRGQSSLLWKLSAGRLVQVGIQFLFITGMMVFYGSLYELAEQWVGRDHLLPRDLDLLFGLCFGIVVLIPIVGLWRNISALALIYSHATARGYQRKDLQPLVELSLKILAAAPLALWFLMLVPFEISLGWVLVALVTGLGLVVVFFKRKMIQWHSTLEYELAHTIAEYRSREEAEGWLQTHGNWNLTLKEVALPDQPDCAGMTLGQIGLHSRFGCSIVSIDRQGFVISNPTAEIALYPNDNLLLLGTEDQIDPAEVFLSKSSRAEEDPSRSFHDMVMETLHIEPGSYPIGRSLRELALPSKYNILITAIRRGERRIASPKAEEKLHAGDEVLVLGVPAQIKTLQQTWAKENGL